MGNSPTPQLNEGESVLPVVPAGTTAAAPIPAATPQVSQASATQQPSVLNPGETVLPPVSDGTTAAAPVPAAPPSTLDTLYETAKNMLMPSSKPVPVPQTANEHIAAIAGGKDSVDALRKSQAVIDAHKALMKAGPDDYADAQSNFVKATAAANGDSTIGPAPKPTVDSQLDSLRAVAKDPFKVVDEINSGLDDLQSKISDYTQEGREDHPVLSKVGDLLSSARELLTGGKSAGKPMGTDTGVLNNPVTQIIAAVPGSAEGAAGISDDLTERMAAETASQAATQPPAVTVPEEPVPSEPNIVQKIVKGEKANQPQAQSALRVGAQNAAEDSGVADEVALDSKQGIRTLADDTIAKVGAKEDALYNTLNEASETDLKSLYDHAEEVQDLLDDPTHIANKSALQKDLMDTQSSIQKGEALAQSKGVDPKTLQDAKALTQQRYALQDVKAQLFNNRSVVKGNVAYNSPESINVDSAISNAEKLNSPSKFAPEGTPTRLQQALGNDGAHKLLQGLYDAQKAGNAAVRARKIAGIVAAVTSEIAHRAGVPYVPGI